MLKAGKFDENIKTQIEKINFASSK